MPLAVVTSFFNHAGFTRPISNLRWFLRFMERDGVPVYGVEAHNATTPTVTFGKRNWKQIVAGERQQLWQKEACLNLAEKLVPDSYDKIAWIDADVWFEDPAWVVRTVNELIDKDVVQPFRNCHWTDSNGKVEYSRPSAVNHLSIKWDTHPGFAWAMRRELWHKAGGLYPYCIAGGGDGAMALAFNGGKFWPEIEQQIGSNHAPFKKWAESFAGIRVGAVDGELYHLWHGDRINRGYIPRRELLAGVDHAKDLQIGRNGLIEWTKFADPVLIKQAADYFKTRKEDG